MMTRLLIIIPRDLLEAGNAFAAQLDPLGGHLTYTHGLYPIADQEQLEPSNYWTNALCSDATVTAVYAAVQAGQFPGGLVFEYNHRTNPGFPDEKLQDLGLARKRSTITQTQNQ